MNANFDEYGQPLFTPLTALTEVTFQIELPAELVAPPKKEKKTADKKAYMREYKRKQYATNPDAIKNANKMYYAKYKYDASEEDCKKYGVMLREVNELRSLLEQFNAYDKEILKEILTPYLI